MSACSFVYGSDGSNVSYTNWHLYQPDNSEDSDCVTFNPTYYEWFDLPCNSLRAFVCRAVDIMPNPLPEPGEGELSQIDSVDNVERSGENLRCW
jgi:hypothetical protein